MNPQRLKVIIAAMGRPLRILDGTPPKVWTGEPNEYLVIFHLSDRESIQFNYDRNTVSLYSYNEPGNPFGVPSPVDFGRVAGP